MLLYDLILEVGRKHKRKYPDDPMYDMLKNAQVFLIDNVAKYWAADAKDVYELNDYPNVAPPYEIFFMEYSFPKKMNIGGKIQETWGNNVRLGTAFIARQRSKSHDTHWEMQFYTFAEENKKLLPEAALVGRFYVRKDGGLSEDMKVNLGISQLVGYENGEAIWEAMVPMLLAISLLHCKNVSVITPELPTPLIKKARKKHGIVPVRYHLLEIEPVKKILRTEGNSEKTGLKYALHICRGHFKDYSEGRGLFGKYKGLYWWESHVRGAAESGLVVKDYNVNPPD